MLGKVFKNYGSLTGMRIISRLFQFALKTYLIRTQLDEEVLAQLLAFDLILTASLHVVKSCLKPAYQKADIDPHIIESSMNIMTGGILVTFISAAIVGSMEYYRHFNSGK